MFIQDRVEKLNEQIARHAGGRSVTLVAVTKYATLPQMLEAYQAGIRHFGENKVQDALDKMAALPEDVVQGVEWHFIGNLQSNKAKKTVGRFSLIHAIDSLSQAEALSKTNLAANSRQRILIQVNLSNDNSRHGVLPDQLETLARDLTALPGIDLRGLMTMAPAEASLAGDATTLRRVFCELRDFRERLEGELAIKLPELSMGMTHDFTHALECGATIIRIGNYLFQNERLALQ